jgi:hypothetical protein
MRIRHPLSEFKIKMIIRTDMDPKHKNFKGPIKIVEAVLQIYNIRRRMSIPRASELYDFQAILNW